MRNRIRNRTVEFRSQDGDLVRTVTGGDGKVYEHRCSLKVYEIVAHVLDETPAEGDGVTMHQIVEAENVPHTQVDVALAFLLDRGVIDRRSRRSYPASSSVHLDAMIEWHALREVGKSA